MHWIHEFTAAFKTCEGMTNLSNANLVIPRTVNCQKVRFSGDYDSPQKYYRQSIFISFLDGLVQELHCPF